KKNHPAAMGLFLAAGRAASALTDGCSLCSSRQSRACYPEVAPEPHFSMPNSTEKSMLIDSGRDMGELPSSDLIGSSSFFSKVARYLSRLSTASAGSRKNSNEW